MNIAIGISDLIRIAPMIVLFFASLIPITIKVFRGNREQVAEGTLLQGIGGLLASAIILLIIYMLISPKGQTSAFAGAVVLDGLTFWVGSIALVAAAVSLVLMYDNPSTKGSQFSELVFLTLSSTLGMLILVSAADLLIVFIGLEMMSLSLYLMIAMSNEEKLSKEAAFKYFVLGSFASAFFLYGVAMTFGTVGSTYIPDIVKATPQLIASNRIFLMGMIFLSLGFCFKVSIVPFHAWTPDVYQGSPTPLSALMATAVKAVSFAAFLRVILSKSLVGSENLFDLLQWLAVITMIVGNVAAIIQQNFKRMLAYSSIAHSGYLLVGVVTAGISDDPAFGSSGIVFYLLSYSLMTMGAFAIVSLIEKDENSLVSVDSLAGLSKKRPVIALCLTIFLLSLAGIPPTIGFFGKFYLFSAAIGEGLLWLAVWGVINSVISVYYYLRPIVVMYMTEGDSDIPIARSATRVAILVSAIFIMILGVLSGPIFQVVEKAL